MKELQLITASLLQLKAQLNKRVQEGSLVCTAQNFTLVLVTSKENVHSKTGKL